MWTSQSVDYQLGDYPQWRQSPLDLPLQPNTKKKKSKNKTPPQPLSTKGEIGSWMTHHLMLANIPSWCSWQRRTKQLVTEWNYREPHKRKSLNMTMGRRDPKDQPSMASMPSLKSCGGTSISSSSCHPLKLWGSFRDYTHTHTHTERAKDGNRHPHREEARSSSWAQSNLGAVRLSASY